MKKLTAFIGCLFLASVIVAMSYYSKCEAEVQYIGTNPISVVKTASGQVKASAGEVYGIKAYWSAYTTGALLRFINATYQNGTYVLDLYPTQYDSTVGLYSCEMAMVRGITFSNAIYMYETAGGNIYVNVVYH